MCLRKLYLVGKEADFWWPISVQAKKIFYIVFEFPVLNKRCIQKTMHSQFQELQQRSLKKDMKRWPWHNRMPFFYCPFMQYKGHILLKYKSQADCELFHWCFLLSLCVPLCILSTKRPSMFQKYLLNGQKIVDLWQTVLVKAGAVVNVAKLSGLKII